MNDTKLLRMLYGKRLAHLLVNVTGLGVGVREPVILINGESFRGVVHDPDTEAAKAPARMAVAADRASEEEAA